MNAHDAILAWCYKAKPEKHSIMGMRLRSDYMVSKGKARCAVLDLNYHEPKPYAEGATWEACADLLGIAYDK